MNIHRRDFLKSASGIVTAGLTSGTPRSAAAAHGQSQRKRRPRIAVFWEKDFPAEDGCEISRELLERAFQKSDTAFLGVTDVNAKLSGWWDLLVNPYGSCFPKECIDAVLRFLREGGNWLNLGGIPLAVPVLRDGTGWRREIRQTQYHKKIGITQAFPVNARQAATFTADESIEKSETLIDAFSTEEIFSLYLRFTVTKDFPNEDGSAGARDAVVRPLVNAMTSEGRSIAAPMIFIDRLLGEYAGGRWVFAPFRGSVQAKAVGWLADFAVLGSMELVTRPTFACYQPGEIPSFTVQFRRPKGGVEEMITEEGKISIRSRNGKRITTLDILPGGYGMLATGYGTCSMGKTLRSGFYRVETTIRLSHPFTDEIVRISHMTGFWVHDPALIEGGRPLTSNESFLLRDGEPFPVTGTTYMTSDVHRKFLFEPNPFVWDRDFSEMRRAGINMIRTGIWTAWKSAMLDSGAPSEAVLRSMDAFVLTARSYDIPVIFTFFSFIPETWGGENPYLDPRSTRAQTEFILNFVHRYRHVQDLVWDCINEPSFCNPNALWKCRPNYDRHEAQAWETWLASRYPAASEAERAASLQEIYRALPGDETSLPGMEEFNDVNIFNSSHPVKVVDYRLFAQEMFAGWAKEMADAIRANGNIHQMITVGQDEGGTYDRPSPFFHHEPLDFTCLHNWWMNDHLLWDNLMMKTPSKPMLLEETGVMFTERMDGTAWRTEEEARDLLERKLALSIAGGGAGFLEWIWNTNPYMLSDNEAAIGLHRADGSAKPELQPLIEYARFYDRHRHLMVGRKPEEIVMVIPHSQMFSPRNLATEATRRCVRALTYHCRARLSAVSEYRLNELRSTPRLILLPSPRVLNENAWQELLRFVSAGATLLATGFLESDEHWMPVPRLDRLGIPCGIKPVAQTEFISIDGTEHRVAFRDNKMERVEKAIPRHVDSGSTGQSQPDGSNRVRLIRHGSGQILWTAIPVELSDTQETTVALYWHAMNAAGLKTEYTLDRDDPAILVLPQFFEKASFYTFISECDRETTLRLTDHRTGAIVSVTIQPGRSTTEVIPVP